MKTLFTTLVLVGLACTPAIAQQSRTYMQINPNGSMTTYLVRPTRVYNLDTGNVGISHRNPDNGNAWSIQTGPPCRPDETMNQLLAPGNGDSEEDGD